MLGQNGDIDKKSDDGAESGWGQRVAFTNIFTLPVSYTHLDVYKRQCHYPRIPFVEITKSAGKELQKKLEEGPLTACLNVEMCQSIVSSTMPVARIQGRSDKYVLVSGHYDSWYEGITDNLSLIHI